MLYFGHADGGLDRRVRGRRALPQVLADLPHRGIELRVEPVGVDAALDIVDEWGVQSFPASDPPANW